MSESRDGGVTRGDLARVAGRSFLLQALWNRERMQGQGFAFALRPVARRLAGRKGEARWLLRHLGYFNTHPILASFALGAVARLEDDRARGQGPPEEAIQRAKGALGPALAAVGDSFFWSTLRPLTATLGIIWVLRGSPFGPLLFLGFYNAFHLLVRVRGVFSGWSSGLSILGEGIRRRLARARLLLSAAGFLLAFGLVDVIAGRLVQSGPRFAPIWLVAGLAVGLAWGEGRRISSAALGVGLFSLALAWASLAR
jgi:PTS system mannose-specific IID component